MQAFYKRFSGPVRALPSKPAGADAWRATTYGHGVLQTNPVGSTLDQESPGSIPGGATSRAASLTLAALLVAPPGVAPALRRAIRTGDSSGAGPPSAGSPSCRLS